MNKSNFNIKKRLLSFKYAFKGIKYVIYTQQNFWIHLFIAFVAVLAGFLSKITTIEWLFIIFCIFFVLICEIINTVIELIIDKISPQYDKISGIIKDVSAGFVLLSAIMAVIIGLIIFIPKFLLLF